MNTKSARLEHRWGERIDLNLTVRLSVRSRRVTHGSMLNVSLSGVFVGTGERIPSAAIVFVEFNLIGSRGSKQYSVPAYVVRETQLGIALEWLEYAPRAIRTLIRMARVGLAIRHAPSAGQAHEDLDVGLYRPSIAVRHNNRSRNDAMTQTQSTF